MILSRSLPRWEEPQLPPYPGEMVRAGRFLLHVRRTPVTPGAEPAVFVHGLGGASTNWTDVMHLLGGQLAGTAVDLPGFGRSPAPLGGRYGLDDHVAAVTALLEAGRRPVHLLGHSLGATVALRLAAQRPRLVRTLTLLAPGLPGPPVPGASTTRMGRFLPLLMTPGVGRVLASRIARSPESLLGMLVHEGADTEASVHPQRYAEAMSELKEYSGRTHAHGAVLNSMRGMVAASLEVGPRSLWLQAATLRMPTVAIFAEQDGLISVKVAERAARTLRTARVLMLPDAGHLLPLERPYEVSAAVLDMLATTAAPMGAASMARAG